MNENYIYDLFVILGCIRQHNKVKSPIFIVDLLVVIKEIARSLIKLLHRITLF